MTETQEAPPLNFKAAASVKLSGGASCVSVMIALLR